MWQPECQFRCERVKARSPVLTSVGDRDLDDCTFFATRRRRIVAKPRRVITLKEGGQSCRDATTTHPQQWEGRLSPVTAAALRFSGDLRSRLAVFLSFEPIRGSSAAAPVIGKSGLVLSLGVHIAARDQGVLGADWAGGICRQVRAAKSRARDNARHLRVATLRCMLLACARYASKRFPDY
jgi:hypothetical protein